MVPNADELAYNSIVINKCLDFGRVDELTQEEIINLYVVLRSVTEIKNQIDLNCQIIYELIKTVLQLFKLL